MYWVAGGIAFVVIGGLLYYYFPWAAAANSIRSVGTTMVSFFRSIGTWARDAVAAQAADANSIRSIFFRSIGAIAAQAPDSAMVFLLVALAGAKAAASKQSV